MSAVTRTRFGWATGVAGLATVVLFAAVFALHVMVVPYVALGMMVFPY